MVTTAIQAIEAAEKNWQPPKVPEDIPQGDMPGDKVWIGPQSIEKANVAFRALLPLLKEVMCSKGRQRAVVAVSGGSGVGKTCVSALLTYYFNQIGVKSYTLSGDNYPRRIPEQNDAERLRIFRSAGIGGMLEAQVYSPETAALLKKLQEEARDPDPGQADNFPFLKSYQAAGRKALAGYLGTELEQEYGLLESVLTAFQNGVDRLWLRRLGRDDTALWYEEKDVSDISLLILEWTHGNSGRFQGVDIPVLLNSTPAETREYRLSRGRDANADTPFITMVLELEQKKLEDRAKAAALILSKSGEVLSYEEFKAQMDQNR